MSSPTLAFLLPAEPLKPAGGPKVVFEYANGLAARGWRVRIVVPHLQTEAQIRKTQRSLLTRLRRQLKYRWRRWRGGYRPDRWFKLDPQVELLYVFSPQELPRADAWVATWWRTAPWVAQCAGARLYLIQHLETYGGPEDEVLATWRLPLRKIVIARWLQEYGASLGEASDYIPNGLDFGAFGLDVPPQQRQPQSLLMLYHHEPWKGTRDGLAAVELLRPRFPELKLRLFGVGPRPADLPAWIEYQQNPPQPLLRALYNQASIFLAPSWNEGWGLPSAEAMMCGCAVAATDNGGHREFAQHEVNALLSPVRQPQQLADNLARLLQDQVLRIRLAQDGHRSIQRFRWDDAFDRFEEVLRRELSATAAPGAAGAAAARPA